MDILRIDLHRLHSSLIVLEIGVRDWTFTEKTRDSHSEISFLFVSFLWIHLLVLYCIVLYIVAYFWQLFIRAY